MLPPNSKSAPAAPSPAPSSRRRLWLLIAAVQVAGGLFALGWWWHLSAQRQAAFEASVAQLARERHPVMGRLRGVEQPSVAEMASRTEAKFEFVARYDAGTATVSLSAAQTDGVWQRQSLRVASPLVDAASAGSLPPR